MEVKVPIVIPQLFYDAIARIIPGAVFLMLAESYRNVLSDSAMSVVKSYNWIESLGRGLELAILAYVIGWILSGMTWPSLKFKTQPDELSELVENDSDSVISLLRIKYQWIRLAHPDAGYRIVKLRAEASMLESLRTALVLSSVTGIILSFALYRGYIGSGNELINLQVILMLICSIALAFVIFTRMERNAWKRYKDNILSIYNILHDDGDPIPISPYSHWPPGDKKTFSDQVESTTKDS